ncbi:MAG: HAMP domain-containing protein, partial [Bradymonadaceae bacterium]
VVRGDVMYLRTRVILGYGVMAVLIIGVAVTSAVGFFDLGERYERAIGSKLEGERAALKMLVAIGEEERLLAADAAGRSDESKSTALESQDATFETALETLESRVSNEEIGSHVAAVKDAYRTYREQRQSVSEDGLSEDAFYRQLLPAIQEVETELKGLLEAYRSALFSVDREARQRAVSYGSWLGFLVVLSFLSIALIARGLHRHLLGPLNEMEDVAAAVAQGDQHRRVQLDRSDELGHLGEQFNRALDQYRELEGHLEGRTRRMKQMLLG